MTEKIHILLPVHNRLEITRLFINSLREQTYSNYHLILIDDCSGDGTVDMVLQNIPDATVIRGPGNWWWAGSLQRAFAWLMRARPDDNAIVLIMNNDTTFEADFLEAGVSALGRNPESLLLARIRNEASGEVSESGVHADLRNLTFRVAVDANEINCLSTKGLFIRWRDMKNVGGFYPRLLPHYWSDYEYSIRAHRKGYACMTDPTVVLVADTSTTGNRTIDQFSGWNLLRVLFSPKTIANPIYKTSFVLLAVPGRWMIPNLIRIWRDAISGLISKLIFKQFPNVNRENGKR